MVIGRRGPFAAAGQPDAAVAQAHHVEAEGPSGGGTAEASGGGTEAVAAGETQEKRMSSRAARAGSPRERPAGNSAASLGAPGLARRG